MIRNYQQVRRVMDMVEGYLHRYLPDYHVELLGENSPLWGKISYGGKKRVLYLNEALIERGELDEIYNTLVHEIAHVYDANRFGKAEHGRDWQDITRALGGNAEVKSYYGVGKHPERYRFRCATCGFEFNSSNMTPPYRVGMHPVEHNRWYVEDEITRQRWTATG